jgi:hypothetical protein
MGSLQWVLGDNFSSFVLFALLFAEKREGKQLGRSYWLSGVWGGKRKGNSGA